MVDKWTWLWCLLLLSSMYLFTLYQATNAGFLKTENSQENYMIGMAYIGCLVATAGMIWNFT